VVGLTSVSSLSKPMNIDATRERKRRLREELAAFRQGIEAYRMRLAAARATAYTRPLLELEGERLEYALEGEEFRVRLTALRQEFYALHSELLSPSSKEWPGFISHRATSAVAGKGLTPP
jgi:hypothetical protein